MIFMQEECTHHWVIDSSDLSSSNKSNGKCKKCNLIKTFFNSIPERDYKWKINLEKSEQE